MFAAHKRNCSRETGRFGYEGVRENKSVKRYRAISTQARITAVK